MPNPGYDYTNNVSSISENKYVYNGLTVISDDHVNTLEVSTFGHRDANKNNPKDVSGWRSPSSFIHYNELQARRAPNAISVHFHYTDPVSHNFVDRYANGSYCSNLDWNIDYPFPTPNQKAKVVSDVLNKLIDQKVNLAQEFVQTRKTADLFSSLARSLYDGIESLRHRQLPDFRGNGLRKASGAFLELVYGVRPLLSDIYGSIDKINESNSGGRAFTVSVNGQFLGTSVGARLFNSSYVIAAINDVSTARYKLALSYFMNAPVLASLSSTGILNPAYVLWQELPWTFVVDQAINVGSYLNALTADYGFTFKGGSESTTINGVSRIASLLPNMAASGLPVGAYGIVENATSGVVNRINATNRTALTSTPVPSLYVKNPLSTLHVAEDLALMYQQLSKGPRPNRPPVI